jgi:predicted dinucleotide-binding enzyme
MVEKVAMIGDGNVGTALTQGLTRAGYEVRAVGKEPQRVKELAGWGDVVVLAVPYGERQNALREMGDAIRGKVLVDVTNALGTGGAYAGSVQKSGAEEVQDMARAAKVVKAFNTVFAQSMSDGRVHGERISTFVAGDDAQAKQKVLQLARDIGFDAVDAGNLENARWIEPMGMLNIKLGYQVGMGPGIGIKLVHESNRAGGAPPPSQPQRTARTT